MNPQPKNRLNQYKLFLSSLPVGESEFTYEISDDFFADFPHYTPEFEGLQMKIHVDVLRTDRQRVDSTLKIRGEGSALLICDRSGTQYRENLLCTLNFALKNGEAFDDEEADVIYLPSVNYALNIATYIYELVLFSLPLKKINPAYDSEDIDFPLA